MEYSGMSEWLKGIAVAKVIHWQSKQNFPLKQ